MQVLKRIIIQYVIRADVSVCAFQPFRNPISLFINSLAAYVFMCAGARAVSTE